MQSTASQMASEKENHSAVKLISWVVFLICCFGVLWRLALIFVEAPPNIQPLPISYRVFDWTLAISRLLGGFMLIRTKKLAFPIFIFSVFINLIVSYQTYQSVSHHFTDGPPLTFFTGLIVTVIFALYAWVLVKKKAIV
jgi:hypothetical protein